MSSIYYFLFAILSIIYTAYVREKSRTRGLKALEERIEANEISYDYNRFNTKPSRKADTLIEKDKFVFSTDVKLIQVTNETLIIKASSNFEDKLVGLEIVIIPFIVDLLKVDSYQQIDQNGIIIFFGNAIEIFFDGDLNIEEDSFFTINNFDNFYWIYDSIIVDPVESAIIFEGKFIDGNDMKICFKHKNFKISIESKLSAIRNYKNYKEYKATE